MKLIILGAGASYDSFYQFHERELYGWRPPLGTDLFGSRENFRKIRKFYEGAESLTSEIRIQADIEIYLQNKWDFISTHRADKLLAKLISTQYYLQELFYRISHQYIGLGISNYEILVRAAHDYSIASGENVCFITFNYDLLLEKALEKELNTQYIDLGAYIHERVPLKVFKPHGSCNWYSRLNTINCSQEHSGNISGYLYKHQLDLGWIYENLDTAYHVFTDIKQINGGYNRQGIVNGGFPRLLIPLKTKDEFTMPPAHVNLMNEYLQKVSKILVIGWKGTEEFFLETLKKQLPNKSIETTIVTCRDKSVEESFTSKIGAEKFRFDHFEEDMVVEKRILGKGTLSSFIGNGGHMEFFK